MFETSFLLTNMFLNQLKIKNHTSTIEGVQSIHTYFRHSNPVGTGEELTIDEGSVVNKELNIEESCEGNDNIDPQEVEDIDNTVDGDVNENINRKLKMGGSNSKTQTVGFDEGEEIISLLGSPSRYDLDLTRREITMMNWRRYGLLM